MTYQQKIIDTLQAAELSAMLPGVHDGKCKSTYYTVADAGITQLSRTAGRRVALVTAFVPVTKQLQLDTAVNAARTAVLSLKASRIGAVSEADIDDENEAMYASFEVSALCSLI